MNNLTWAEYKQQLRSKGKNEADEINVTEKTVEIISKIIIKRQSKNISQKKLAEMVGVKQSAIARIETFKHEPRLDTILRLLAALDMKVEVVNESDYTIIIQETSILGCEGFLYAPKRHKPRVVFNSF